MRYQKFSDRQRLTLTWWNSSRFQGADGILCDGSIRSGKTLSMTVGFLLWSMSQFDGQSFAICGKTVESLRRNVTDNIPLWVEGLFQTAERRSENRIIVTGGGHSNTYYLFGGRDESSYTLIQGMTLAGVLLDEVALMPRSFVEQALARCSVSGSKFWFNCNPGGPEHWFYTEWVKRAKKRNVLYLHFTMEDNHALEDDVRARYERMYSGVFYDRYIRGLWVAAKGLIYDGFNVDRHVLRNAPETSGGCYVSVDYGTLNPTVFLLWQRESGSERWVCLREYYWDGRAEHRQKTDGEYADDFQKFSAGYLVRSIIVDPSAASFIQELRRRGLPVEQADNRVVDGIRQVGELLRNEQLAVMSGCVKTISEFRAYVWDEKSSAQGIDKPVKDHDHCMDALRYFVTTVLGRASVRVRRRPRGL